MDYLLLPRSLRAALDGVDIAGIRKGCEWDLSADCRGFEDWSGKLGELQAAGLLASSQMEGFLHWLENPTYETVVDGQEVKGEFSICVPIAILSGWTAYQAAEKMEAKPWADWQARGFSSQLEAMGAIGAALTSGSLDLNKGYHWNGPTGDYLITGDVNADLRVFRQVAGDPICHYGSFQSRLQPTGTRQSLYAYHSNEGLLLAAIISGATQTGVSLDCFDRPDRFKDDYLQSLEKLGRSDALFCPTGAGSMEAAHCAGSAVFPLTRPGARSIHSLAREFGDPYSMHLDGGDLVIYSGKSLVLRLPGVEWNQAVLGLFIQAARHGGRTPVSQLAEIVELTGQPDWRAEFVANRVAWAALIA
jgi:hypothetical protein